MKIFYKVSLVLVCLIVPFALDAQSPNSSNNSPLGTPGACRNTSAHNNQIRRSTNPNPQDGTGTLGQSYNFTKCGLNFVTSSQKLGQRYSPPGLVQPAIFPVSGIPPCANIEKAFLYCDASGTGIAQTASITNPLSVNNSFPMTIIGSGPDKCWSYAGTYSYRADVTSIIAGNGNYTLSGLATNNTTSGNDVDGATLIIIYSDPTAAYQGTIMLDDGCIEVSGGTANYNQSYPAPCGPTTNAQSFCIAADLQMPVNSLSLNGTPTTFTWNWWNYIQTATTVATAQTTSNYNLVSTGDCFNLMLVGLYYQTTSCTTCPASNTTLSLTTASTVSTCTACNGTASVVASGGTPPYTYSWSPSGGTGASATNLCSGTYTVTVTANNGCLVNTATVTVGNSGGLTATTSTTAASCNASCNGSATATPSGGTGPYTYSWTPSGGNAATAGSLCAGTYTCSVTDANGCLTSQTATINQPAVLSEAITSVAPGCSSPTGSATSTPSGGTGPYTYSWTPSGGTSSTATGLSPGTYTCAVTDAQGCTTSQTVTLNTGTSVVLTSTSTNVACNGGNTGSASVTASGGNGVYTYSWTPSGGNAATAVNLNAGSYTCTVTDGNGCTASQVFTITQPAAFSGSPTSSAISCNGGNGTVTAVVTGGTPTYSYFWSPIGGSAATSTPVPAGTYTCTITDANGCTTTQTITLTQPAALADSASHINVLCHGNSTGAATVAVTGGTGAYTYSWSPGGGSSATASNLTAGIYTCTIHDANGCVIIAKDTITQPQVLALFGMNDTICAGDSATISVIRTGGTPPATITWNNSLSNGNSHVVRPATTTEYVATATDSHGCVTTDTILVVVNPLPHASFTSNAENGQLLMSSSIHPVNLCLTNTSTGATSYQWSLNTSTSVETSPCFSMVDTGNYCVHLLAISAQGCKDTSRLCIHVEESMYMIPNVFTPNGDGQNDVFKIINLGMKSLRCTIYDRWGVKVYEWNSTTGFWDGKLKNGSFASDGTYYYVAELIDEADKSYNAAGFVQLIK